MYNTVLSLEQYVKDPCWYLARVIKPEANRFEANICAAIHGFKSEIDPFHSIENFKRNELWKNKLIFSLFSKNIQLVQIRHVLEGNTIKVQVAAFFKSGHFVREVGNLARPYIYSGTSNMPYHQISKLIHNYSILPDELNELISRIPNIYV